jgi:uncharacterized protein DUF3750
LKVQLLYAPLPYIGAIARHYWFVVCDETGRHRWEVWQTKNAGGFCIGHVHRDLKDPDAGVGGGPSRVVIEWEGDEAVKITEVLGKIQGYPHCERYRMWPGPNSNTFVAWVLRQAGIEQTLDPRAIGRNYFTAKQ